MTKFIILTDKDSGKKVYVNPSAIQLIHESCLTGQLSSEKHNSTIVSFYGGKYLYIEVSESPESIMNLIQITEENRRAHETNA